MQSDSTGPHAPLRAILESTLREDIHVLPSGAPEAGPQLHGSIARVCKDARQRGLLVEQLIVLIKEVWLTVPAGRYGLRHFQSHDVLADIVAHAINCYYSPVD